MPGMADDELEGAARTRPTPLAAPSNIWGPRDAKVKRFGKDILALSRSHA